MISQKRLKEILHYDPETGVFTRLVSRGGILAGSVAGTVNSRGYRLIGINGKIYMAHRLAILYMTGDFPPHYVDHINQDPRDNRWLNLRAVTKSQNQRNSTRYANNTSGFNGVHWNKQRGKWHVRAGVDGKRKHIGFFDSLLDAVAARIRFNRENGFYRNHGAEKGFA